MTPATPPTADDVWRRMDATSSRPMLGLAAAGALLVIGTVVWWPHLVVYLVGLGMLAVGVLSAIPRLLRGRRRWVAAGLVVALTALAVLLPWWSAHRERTGAPHWTLATNGNVWEDYVDVDRGRYLGADSRSLFAVDLTDGSVLWSVIDLGEVRSFDVSADGYVLARSRDEIAWISPEGEILWRVGEGTDQVGASYARWGVAGVSGGVVAFERCEDDADEDTNDPCVFVGVGADGAQVWKVQGFRGVPTTTPVTELSLNGDGPRELAQALVIDLDEDERGRAAVVDATTGVTAETIDVVGAVAVSGELVVYQTNVAADRVSCRNRGTDLDGALSWEAQTPCPRERGNGPSNVSWTVTGTMLYAAQDAPDGEAAPAFALDMTTGSWIDVGVLAWFNLHADAFGGEAGAELVVARDQQQLTGIDPRTGEELWSYDAGGDGIPGVDPGHGAVVVLSYPDRGHNPFLAGRDHGQLTVLLDARTGRVTARLWLRDTVWDVIPCGPGRAVVVNAGQLSLIGTAP